MKNITISKDNESKRLNRFLFSYFGNASESFIYKMLRKKNIVLNDKKASGSEILKEGDIISVYFSDETFEKFKSGHDDRFDNIKFDNKNVLNKEDIVFEDENIIVINKRAGILSQKSQKDDISINEMALNYMYLNKEIDGEKLKNFVPSILNRLDRNTSGLIIFGKNYKVSKLISFMFAENKIERYYTALCYFDAKCAFSGKEDVIVSSDYIKDENENKACLSNTKFISENEIEKEIKNSKIVTRFKIINSSSNSSKIEAKLVIFGSCLLPSLRGYLSSSCLALSILLVVFFFSAFLICSARLVKSSHLKLSLTISSSISKLASSLRIF